MNRNLRCNLFMIILLATGSSATAQSEMVTGHVQDSVTRQPIEYATISLVDVKTHQTTTGTVSNAEGVFSMEISKNGLYSLLIEAIGFQPKNLSGRRFDKNTTQDLGSILLSQKVSALQSVTITGGQKLIENKIDKMVFNAEKDLTSQGGVLTDILKKIPQISVDVDGNVELAGSSSIRFLIDGKPSTAFGSNIADVLQSIPASQIKSIEVITNPGAKYDAEGLGGIINIILKHNGVRGINGSVSLTAASRNENGAVNLSVRNNDFGVNVFFNANARLPSTTPLTSTRISQDTASQEQVVLNQDGNSRFYRYGVESGLSLDYSFQKKNNLTFSLSYNHFGTTNNGSQNQSQSSFDSQGLLLSQMLSSSLTQSGMSLAAVNGAWIIKELLQRRTENSISVFMFLPITTTSVPSIHSLINQPTRRSMGQTMITREEKLKRKWCSIIQNPSAVK